MAKRCKTDRQTDNIEMNNIEICRGEGKRVRNTLEAKYAYRGHSISTRMSIDSSVNVRTAIMQSCLTHGCEQVWPSGETLGW